MQSIGRIVNLGAGCRKRSILCLDDDDESLQLEQLPSKLLQCRKHLSVDVEKKCVWLSLCLVVHYQKADDAIVLLELMSNSNLELNFDFVKLNDKELIHLVQQNTKYELRKVSDFHKTKDSVYFLLNQLEKNVVCVLKDNNGSSSHAVGVISRDGVRYILDPQEKTMLPLKQKYLNRCCGENLTCIGISAMREVHLKRSKKY